MNSWEAEITILYSLLPFLHTPLLLQSKMDRKMGKIGEILRL